MNRKLISATILFTTIAVGSAYAYFGARTPVDFYKGHTHENMVTIGAPSHSGGTNSSGCHNASVPYHCH